MSTPDTYIFYSLSITLKPPFVFDRPVAMRQDWAMLLIDNEGFGGYGKKDYGYTYGEFGLMTRECEVEYVQFILVKL